MIFKNQILRINEFIAERPKLQYYLPQAFVAFFIIFIIGYFSFNGCCDFAIAIRSIFADGKSGFVQAGAGIVFDSIAKNELNETEHKANAMITALKEASK